MSALIVKYMGGREEKFKENNLRRVAVASLSFSQLLDSFVSLKYSTFTPETAFEERHH